VQHFGANVKLELFRIQTLKLDTLAGLGRV
jgi:hypothetical protein